VGLPLLLNYLANNLAETTFESVTTVRTMPTVRVASVKIVATLLPPVFGRTATEPAVIEAPRTDPYIGTLLSQYIFKHRIASL